MNDIEIIHVYLDSHASPCFTLLYDRYSRKIFHKCLGLLKDEAEAKDATQEVMMKIVTNLAKFGERAKFSTWVYSITFNYCMDKLRKRQRNPEVDDEPDPNWDVEEEDGIDDKILLEMDIEVLKRVLDRLRPDDRMVLLMKYQDDLSIKEIAEAMDKSESAIKMKIKRAKEKARDLRDEIELTLYAEA